MQKKTYHNTTDDLLPKKVGSARKILSAKGHGYTRPLLYYQDNACRVPKREANNRAVQGLNWSLVYLRMYVLLLHCAPELPIPAVLTTSLNVMSICITDKSSITEC